MEGAPGVGFRPFVSAYDIENTRPSGILALGCHDLLLSLPMAQRLRSCIEARAQQNKLGLAAEDLNAVRDRAGVGLTAAATQEQLLLAIENENRLEFGLEPHRWFDLVRTGRAQQVLGITDPNKLLLPIPSDEIIIDDALIQNPGY